MTAELVPFKLITNDQTWIASHDGHPDGHGHITVMLPADQVEQVEFAKRDWLRHTFATRPRDVPSATVMCPVKWISP